MFETVRFIHGQALYLLLLLPLVWLARRRWLTYLQESRTALTTATGAPAAKVGALIRPRLAGILFFGAALLLILALARPQVFSSARQEILRQLDVVFLLDISPSMGAEDIAPSRLDRATRVIREIVTGEPRIQRVGLVTFTRSSLILSYLTSDVQNVLFYLDFLHQQPLPGVGTNLGAAVNSGMQVIGRSREEADPAENHPVLIVLSDGEDHEEELEGALQQAATSGLTIHTIGIGSNAGGFIPRPAEDGALRFLEDAHGTRLISRLDESTLRRVAEVTGGRFYRATEGEQVLFALQEIVARESHVVGFLDEERWIELYHVVLATTAVLALLGWVVGRG